ncbi:MAG: hypothetical protein ABIF71_05855 [Planctomycetota bacterium]
MSVHLKPEHLTVAEDFVRRAHAHNGLAPLDLDRFWADQAKARQAPFAPDCPQAALGIMMSHECVFDELGIPEDWHRLAHDFPWRAGLCRRYNDSAEKIVGRRRLTE